MKKRTLLIIGIAVVIIAAVVIFLNLPHKQYFQYVNIQRGDIEQTIASTGNLQFDKTNNVNAQIAGTIAGVYTDFNKKVYKGQLLTKLDDSLLAAAVDEAKANLDNAKALLIKAQQDYDDAKALFDQKFKAQTDLNTAANTLVSAKVAVETMQAELEKAQINLKYAYIRSPMNGFVVQKNAEIGQVVSTGSIPLFIIASDRSKMQILAAVAEGDISQVKRGEKSRFTVQAYSDKTFNGTVSDIYLQPVIIQNVVNFTVVIDFIDKEGLLMPGMTATIDIVTDSRTNILKIPNSVLKFRPTQQMYRQFFGNATNNNMNRFRGTNQGMANRQTGQQSMRTNQQNGTVLWISDEKTGRVQPVRVKLGMSDGQMTEIESDRISEGMSVISGLSNQNGQSGRNISQSTSPFQGAFPGGGGMGMR